MSNLRYEDAAKILEDTFQNVESAFLGHRFPGFDHRQTRFLDTIFESKTQAYRETLLGCILARILDEGIDITQPYVGQGPAAFNGRTLDEKVVNPFLRSREIPCPKGPYLGVFRRNVRFNQATKKGLRDKEGYDAFLKVSSYAVSIREQEKFSNLLWDLLYRFLLLREESRIQLSELHRISLDQYDCLLTGLLATPSGGRIPVFLVVAMLQTIKEAFGLDWTISFQGINVADEASGASGDVTIARGENVLLAAEITERPVERSRVEATFRAKISRSGIDDYLFWVDEEKTQPEAREQARKYFAQGHDVNFIDIKKWILMSLVTVGRRGRATFSKHLLSLLDAQEVPRLIKVAWNKEVQKLTS